MTALAAEVDEVDENATGCPHPDAHRTGYTGTLCSACYRDVEMRIRGFAHYCRILRVMAAPSGVTAARYGERVQETKGEQRLIIDAGLLELCDRLYRAGVDLVLATATRIYVDPPHALRNVLTAPAYAANDPQQQHTAAAVEAWIDRNLWLLVALPDAYDLTAELVDALIDARKVVDPRPPSRRATRRANCRKCLGTRLRIEARERGVFYSSCGDCGQAGPVHASAMEAVLRGDSDRSGEDDGPAPTDPLAVSSERSAPVDEAGPQRIRRCEPSA